MMNNTIYKPYNMSLDYGSWCKSNTVLATVFVHHNDKHQSDTYSFFIIYEG